MVISALLSLLIGVVLGMLGGGGAILTLPMLVHAVGVEPKAAIAMSLFVVGSTSLVGTSIHARARAVRLKIGLAFGGAAMAGAFAGGHIAAFVPASVLLVVFAIMMLVTATAMLRKRAAPLRQPHALALGRALALGVGVGALSGLVGAGGGFLIVPALTIFGGLAMREAVGTSLFVITLQSFAGFAGHASHVELEWTLIAIVTGSAIVGTVIGALSSKKVSPDTLRRGFAWLVIVMGLFVMSKQVPVIVTVVVAAITAIAILVITRGRPRIVQKETCTTSPHSLH